LGGGGGARGGTTGTRQYYGNGEIGEATISIDPESRRLIVIADEDTIPYISQVITNLDQPKPQVLIRVVFLEVTYRNFSDVGLEGTLKKKVDTTTSALASNLFGLNQGMFPVPPGAGIYQLLGNDFSVTLRAISQAGKLEILSRPSILARNNQQASITVGSEVPLITNVRFDTVGNQINTIQYEDVGIFCASRHSSHRTIRSR
jgi:general secretion pathway protein D